MLIDLSGILPQLLELVILLATGVALWFARTYLGVLKTDQDAKMLNDVIRRGISAVVENRGGLPSSLTYNVRSEIGREVLEYAMETSPDLMGKFNLTALTKRIDAQIADERGGMVHIKAVEPET